ncbi:carboxylesterase family protein [Umezawaea sp. Da 62-37]|uniref:carboxylesterase/lipase family protein n=1 Tax=Umezawaea sp. Da 62-37 TaxID=3075927 RepID=UPI0028F6C411|nr:carboxylesterase family protein [Umezawaea sp. Da 62-37]WNV82945.1 carboxylesterase family protein [Umezawaea sp. Da 62-37]
MVKIEQGLVAGVEEVGVHRFLGILYAAPPVGDLRWAPPARPARWDGVRDATEFGNAAVQTVVSGIRPGVAESEDCLFLNVWTTTLEPSARQPVMVWIHGGGFLNCAASVSQWTGRRLARRGVTVVSMNYRLGAFGFLARPGAGANAAVLDWVAALGWVAANIESFGGDPGAVTIFGQSAGAAAVRTLLSTPTARGLFHRGIIQSLGFEDYAVVASPSRERTLHASDALYDRLGGKDIDALRTVPTEAVRAASFALSGVEPPPGQLHTPANLVWYPTVDGDVVTDDFAGWPSGVPVMFGTTQDEARAFLRPTGIYSRPDLDPAAVYTPDTLDHMVRALAGERSGDVLAHFAERGLSPYRALAELTTAAVWLEPAQDTHRRFAALDRASYHYHFSRVSPGAQETGLLAYHGAEIPYVFGFAGPDEPWNALGGTSQAGLGFDEVDRAVSDAVQYAWIEFARTGVPRHLDGTAWPTCDRSAPQVALIGDTGEDRLLEVSPLVAMIASQRGSVA